MAGHLARRPEQAKQRQQHTLGLVGHAGCLAVERELQLVVLSERKEAPDLALELPAPLRPRFHRDAVLPPVKHDGHHCGAAGLDVWWGERALPVRQYVLAKPASPLLPAVSSER